MKEDRAWIELDFGCLKSNVEALTSLLPPHGRLMAIVKANAYGHGDILISRELNRLGIDSFAVAALSEGIHLRENGIKGEILVLGYTLPDECRLLTEYNLTQTVVDSSYARELNSYGLKVKTHVKIDTGMHRLGESYNHLEQLREIFRCNNLIISGTYTHLCAADSLLPEDTAFTKQQIAHFYGTIAKMKASGFWPGKIHIQSSYGLLNYPDLLCDYARPGIALYGNLSSPGDKTRAEIPLKPVLSLKARVAMVRDLEQGECVGYGRDFTADKPCRIAAVTIGYADGLPRNFSSEDSYVLIHGCKAPVIGRICMDQFMVNVSDIPSVHSGDVVTIIGRDGTLAITAEQISKTCGTITNELLSRMGERLTRIPVSPVHASVIAS